MSKPQTWIKARTYRNSETAIHRPTESNQCKTYHTPAPLPDTGPHKLPWGYDENDDRCITVKGGAGEPDRHPDDRPQHQGLLLGYGRRRRRMGGAGRPRIETGPPGHPPLHHPAQGTGEPLKHSSTGKIQGHPGPRRRGENPLKPLLQRLYAGPEPIHDRRRRDPPGSLRQHTGRHSHDGDIRPPAGTPGNRH